MFLINYWFSIIIILVLIGIKINTTHWQEHNCNNYELNQLDINLSKAQLQAYQNRSRFKIVGEKNLISHNYWDGYKIIDKYEKIVLEHKIKNKCNGKIAWHSNLGLNKSLIFNSLGLPDGQQGSFYYCVQGYHSPYKLTVNFSGRHHFNKITKNEYESACQHL